MKIVSFYDSYEQIGNHEAHITKVGKNFPENNSYRVTKVVNNKAEIIFNDESILLEPGMLLGINALIKTNNSYVEVTGKTGGIYRLAPHSEFCLEETVEGVKPVLYGDIYYYNPDNTIFAGGKYRTSCWVAPEALASNIEKYVIERNGVDSDIYYSFDESYSIYEYDEVGGKFNIITLPPFHKCALSFDFSKQMRERYTVIDIAPMTAKDIANVFTKYQDTFTKKTERKVALENI